MREDKNTQHHAMLIYFEPPTTDGPDSARLMYPDAPRHHQCPILQHSKCLLRRFYVDFSLFKTVYSNLTSNPKNDDK